MAVLMLSIQVITAVAAEVGQMKSTAFQPIYRTANGGILGDFAPRV